MRLACCIGRNQPVASHVGLCPEAHAPQQSRTRATAAVTLMVACRLEVKEHTMSLAISILITFLVVILVLYLINMLPIDGRAKQIARVIVIVIGVLSLLRYLSAWPI
jgi:hypothetical protein